MKNILYISYDGMTDQLGQSQVIPYLRELTKRGYRFHILSVEKKEKLKANGEQIRMLLEQAGIKWTTLLFSRRPPLLSKLFDQWKLNAKALKIAKEERPDMVQCRSYVPAAAGLRIKEQLNIPVLFDMRGFWVDERVDSGLWKLKNPIYSSLYKRYKKKEKQYFAKSDHIISLTHKGREELVNAYDIPAEKITVIPCCADMQHFDFKNITADQRTTIRLRLGIDKEAPVLSYLGSLGGWYLTEEMLDFFAVLQQQRPGSVFLFITHDPQEKIIAKANERGIAASALRVQPAGRNEVPLFLAVSNWNIFFIKDAYSKKASSPTKQGEVMAMGIPVICNDIGDTGKIVEESGSGYVMRNFTVTGYSEACKHLDEKLYDRENIRESAMKYYDLEEGVNRYEEVYSSMLK